MPKNDLDISETVDIEGDFSHQHSKPVDPRSEVEKAKAWIIKALVIIFGSTIGCCFVLIALEIIFPSSDREMLKDTATSILFAETVILGTILGFYFGDRSQS